MSGTPLRIIRRTASGSVKSTVAQATVGESPVKLVRLDTPWTIAPASTSFWHSRVPMNPLAPVTRTRTSRQSFVVMNISGLASASVSQDEVADDDAAGPVDSEYLAMASYETGLGQGLFRPFTHVGPRILRKIIGVDPRQNKRIVEPKRRQSDISG